VGTSALQGITIADPNLPDCPLMYVNEAFCRMTGYERDEIVGRNCRFLQGPDTDPGAVARIREAMQQVRRRRQYSPCLSIDFSLPVFTFHVCQASPCLPSS